jgi:hypothetical protein
MNIHLIFFFLLGMASSTVHIDKSFSKMKIGIGIDMTIHTNYLAHVVDILSPFLRIHEDRANFSFAGNLEDPRFSMTFKAILICIGVIQRGYSVKEEDK